MARARLARGAAGLLLSALAACRGAEAPAPWLERLDDDDLVVAVGVADLRADDLDTSPRLAAFLREGIQWTDARASGTGAAQALSVLDGRPALHQMRSRPRAGDGWASIDWSFDVLGVEPGLRSQPEWVHARGPSATTDPLAHPFPTVDSLRARTVHLLLTAPGGDRNAWIDEGLVAFLRAVRTAAPARAHVLLFGIPGTIGDLPGSLHVPLAWWGPDDAVVPRAIDDAVRTHDLAANLLGRTIADPDLRWAAWAPGPGEEEGGVYLETADHALVPTMDAFRLIDRRDGSPDADATARAPAVTDSLATRLADVLFGGTPRAWIAVRGSDVVDFVDLSVFGHQPLEGRITEWALEPIDNVWREHENVARYSLAAEPRTDGVLVDLHWPPYRVEVRVTGPMDEGSWIGAPMYLGEDARSWGFRALRLHPWSRAFWLASAGTWPATADAWWPDAAVGVHVIVDGAAVDPVPASWDDEAP